jgi:hypothetical protein
MNDRELILRARRTAARLRSKRGQTRIASTHARSRIASSAEKEMPERTNSAATPRFFTIEVKCQKYRHPDINGDTASKTSGKFFTATHIRFRSTNNALTGE